MTAAIAPSECVYLIRDNETGLHKIGMTANWSRRSRELQVGHSTTAVRLFPCSDAMKWEKVLHSQFKHKRIPQSEWFRVTEDEVLPKMQWLMQRVETGRSRMRYVVGQWKQASAGHYYRRRKSQSGHWYTQTSTYQQVWAEAEASLAAVVQDSAKAAENLARREPGFWPSKESPSQLEWAERDPSLATEKLLGFIGLAGLAAVLVGLATANWPLFLGAIAIMVFSVKAGSR